MGTQYAGRGDPARTMALLWGVPKTQTRGPKPGLTVEAIVHTAIQLADAEGLPSLSMRRVAEHLGVGAMSLYTYVPAKAELFDLMVDTVLSELPKPDATPGSWRARLERYARDVWALYLRHPWMLEVSGSRSLLGPNEVSLFEAALHAVDGLGLSGREMVEVVSLVEDYVRGAARRAADARYAEQRTGVSDDQWWAAREPIFSEYFDPARYPTLVKVEASGAFAPQPDGADYNLQRAIDSFEFGLPRVLDGVQALVDTRIV